MGHEFLPELPDQMNGHLRVGRRKGQDVMARRIYETIKDGLGAGILLELVHAESVANWVCLLPVATLAASWKSCSVYRPLPGVNSSNRS